MKKRIPQWARKLIVWWILFVLFANIFLIFVHECAEAYKRVGEQLGIERDAAIYKDLPERGGAENIKTAGKGEWVMRCTVMGMQKLSFDGENGQRVEGTKLHLLAEEEEYSEEMIGHRCAALFTRLPIGGIDVGDTVDLIYDTPLGAKRSRLMRVEKVVA